MEKPATVVREEFINNLVKLVNETPLPAFAKVDVIRQVLTELNELARQQYQRDLERYQSESAVEEANAQSGVAE